jgi:hypothetical protein
MAKSLKTAVLVGLVALVGVLSPASARAETLASEYAIFTIRNPRNVVVHYQIRWGENGNWENHSIPANHSRWHSFRLYEDGTAPRPYIRFDFILGDGQVTFKNYQLRTYTSRYQESL